MAWNVEKLHKYKTPDDKRKKCEGGSPKCFGTVDKKLEVCLKCYRYKEKGFSKKEIPVERKLNTYEILKGLKNK